MRRAEESYLCNALFVLSSEKNGPGYSAGILSLKEERFGLAILKSKNLAVTSDIELALETHLLASLAKSLVVAVSLARQKIGCVMTNLAGIDLRARKGVVLSFSQSLHAQSGLHEFNSHRYASWRLL